MKEIKEEARRFLVKSFLLKKVLSQRILPQLIKDSVSFSLFWVEAENGNPQVIINMPWEDAIALVGNPQSGFDIPRQLARGLFENQNFTVLASFSSQELGGKEEPLILLSVHEQKPNSEAK